MRLTQYSHTETIVIDRPNEVVFDFVSEPMNDPTWCAEVSGYEQVNDACTGMACYRFVQHHGSRRSEEHLEILERSALSRYRTRMTVMGAKASALIEFSAAGDGTRVTHTNTVTMPWSLVWQRPFRHRTTRQLMREQLTALKALLERS